jgi:hypothetical protein
MQFATILLAECDRAKSFAAFVWLALACLACLACQ